MTLFSNSETSFTLPLKDADVIYFPNYFTLKDSNTLYKTLLNTIRWQQDYITLFGKTHKQPRLTALYANNNKPYTYSNITMHPKVFSKTLLTLKQRIETSLNHNFTTCLANYYRDGNDSNGWHADNEKELGKQPLIASVSFGATRSFQLKHKLDNSQKHKLDVTSGSLLVMKGVTQDYWKHQIPKTKKNVSGRINLTFRTIL